MRHTLGAEGLALIAGEAGTGKTATLAAVRDAYEGAGYRVIGMAWTNNVVDDLRRTGFRDAATVAGELYRLNAGAVYRHRTGGEQWDQRTALVVDEAAMLSTQHLAAVTAAARQAGAKLILAGDDRQLASIERGGLFGALKERHGAAELHEVMRVSDVEQRRAFNLMHRGEYLPALAIFARQGAVRWHRQAGGSARGPGRELGARCGHRPRYSRASSLPTPMPMSTSLMPCCGRYSGTLDGSARSGSSTPRTAVLPLPSGTGIQFTATDKRQGLFNGAAGTVQAIDGKRLTVWLDGRRDRTLEIDTDEFKGLRHGYVSAAVILTQVAD